jgi:hypothetical protein
MSIKEKIVAILNPQQRNSYNEIDVKFYKDCLHDVPHGEIVVSCKAKRLDNVAVPFVFTGMTVPPVLTARLMADIWSAAESQGLVPHFLIPETYGRMVEEDEAPAASQDPAVLPEYRGTVTSVGHTLTLSSKIPAVQRRQGSGEGDANVVRNLSTGDVDLSIPTSLHSTTSNQSRLLNFGARTPTLGEARRVTSAEVHQMVQSYLVDFVPRSEMDKLTLIQQEELQALLLISVHNDTHRPFGEQAITARAGELIENFFQKRASGKVELKFPRSMSSVAKHASA